MIIHLVLVVYLLYSYILFKFFYWKRFDLSKLDADGVYFFKKYGYIFEYPSTSSDYGSASLVAIICFIAKFIIDIFYNEPLFEFLSYYQIISVLSILILLHMLNNFTPYARIKAANDPESIRLQNGYNSVYNLFHPEEKY